MIDSKPDIGAARRRSRAQGVIRWGSTPTGSAYLVLLLAAAVLLVVSVEAAVAVMLVAMATVVPLKLSVADDTRRRAWARSLADTRRLREIERLTGRLDDRVAASARRLDQTDDDIANLTADLKRSLAAARQERADGDEGLRREMAERSQDVQRVALSAVDVARGEWADLLRAERRRTSAVRSAESSDRLAAFVVTDRSTDGSETAPTRIDRHA